MQALPDIVSEPMDMVYAWSPKRLRVVRAESEKKAKYEKPNFTTITETFILNTLNT